MKNISSQLVICLIDPLFTGDTHSLGLSVTLLSTWLCFSRMYGHQNLNFRLFFTYHKIFSSLSPSFPPFLPVIWKRLACGWSKNRQDLISACRPQPETPCCREPYRCFPLYFMNWSHVVRDSVRGAGTSGVIQDPTTPPRPPTPPSSEAVHREEPAISLRWKGHRLCACVHLCWLDFCFEELTAALIAGV